jgi:methyl-accepting chemotaxis protein
MPKPRLIRREVMPLVRPQMKLALTVCLPIIVASLSISGITTYFFLTSLRSHGALNSDLARRLIPIAGFVLAMNLLILVPTFMFVSIWVSHKILGPLRRLAKEMEDVGAGRLHGSFSLRRGDELRFLADAFNNMRDALRDYIRECATRHGEVEAAERSLDVRAVPELAEAVSREKEALDRFEIVPSATAPVEAHK